GRVAHYVCRRDDKLRGGDGDEVPNIRAGALRDAGADDAAISVIPDEQEAIDAALRMGQAGDLLLVFADALARSWKQVTKFRPEGAATGPAKPVQAPPLALAIEESTLDLERSEEHTSELQSR